MTDPALRAGAAAGLVQGPGLAGLLLLVAYPFLAHAALLHLGARMAALGGLAGLALSLALRLPQAGRARRALLAQHGAVAAALAGALVLDDRRVLLLFPALASAAAAAVFATTLWSGPPLVERIARAWDGDAFVEAMTGHCRQATAAWAGLLALNAGVIASLAFTGPLGAWTLYTGVLSYLTMGALFAGEWALRRSRKRRLAAAATREV